LSGGILEKAMGAIMIACASCGRVYTIYTLGDGSVKNKVKYGGVPTPSKALSGYGLVCDNCGRELGVTPFRIRTAGMKKFFSKYRVVVDKFGRPFLVPLSRDNMVSESIRAAHDLSTGLIPESAPAGVEAADS